MKVNKRWDEFELCLLNECDDSYQLSQILNRSEAAIQRKLKTLAEQISFQHSTRKEGWMHSDIKFVVTQLPKRGIEYCVKYLQRPYVSVYAIYKQYNPDIRQVQHTPWQLKWDYLLYPDMPIKSIDARAKLLGCSIKTAKQRLTTLFAPLPEELQTPTRSAGHTAALLFCNQFFDEHRVVIEENYNNLRFPDSQRLMHFDIVVYDYDNLGTDIIVEYQGQQHFEPIKYFGGLEKFYRTQACDQHKRNAIRSCPTTIYVEIPYTWNNQENSLIKLLQQYGVQIDEQISISG